MFETIIDIQGITDEEKFCKFLESSGFNILRANEIQQKKEHWDILLLDYNLRLEFKSRKSWYKGSGKDQDLILIEYNCVGGGEGWIYGKSDIVVFERDDEYISISKKALLNRANSKNPNIKGDNNKPREFYKLYTRVDKYGEPRKDLFMYMPFSDIEDLIRKRYNK